MVSKPTASVAKIMNMSLFKILLVTGLLSLFIALGMWQLNRAQEKEMIRDRILVRMQMPVVDLDSTAVVTDDLLFRKAEARGRYLPEYQIFLDNKVYNGRAGYHVLTPLRIRGADTLLLVNRGWAPWGLDRQRAPVEEPPSGDITIVGRLAKPARAPITLGDDGTPEGFARVWQNFDVDRFRALSNAPVFALVMELENGSDPSDLVREWPTYDDTWIQRHQAYAIQWFGVATLLLVLAIINQRRGR